MFHSLTSLPQTVFAHSTDINFQGPDLTGFGFVEDTVSQYSSIRLNRGKIIYLTQIPSSSCGIEASDFDIT